jgi:hypothetical protein
MGASNGVHDITHLAGLRSTVYDLTLHIIFIVAERVI